MERLPPHVAEKGRRERGAAAARAAFFTFTSQRELDDASASDAAHVARCRHPVSQALPYLPALYLCRRWLLSSAPLARLPGGSRVWSAVVPLGAFMAWKLLAPESIVCFLPALAGDTPLGAHMRAAYAAQAPQDAWLLAAEEVAADSAVVVADLVGHSLLHKDTIYQTMNLI